MRVIPFGSDEAQEAAMPDVIAHLRAGGLIAYPTETVFGLGGLAQPLPTRRLAELKARDAAKPFILLVSRRDQVDGLVWTPAARALATAFWPGPLTLVLREPDGRYPPGIASKEGGVAIRETPHEGMRALISALGEPITSTSANSPGGRPAVTTDQARALLRDLPSRADVWLLDGVAGGAQPSTVVDCSADRARLVRAGAVPLEGIREIVHDIAA